MTAIVTETGTLTSLDFRPTQHCEHHCHNLIGWQHLHGGPATHYAQIVHQCPADPSKGLIYPVCRTYAAYINRMRDRPWMCPSCRDCQDGRDMIRVIALIEGK